VATFLLAKVDDNKLASADLLLAVRMHSIYKVSEFAGLCVLILIIISIECRMRQ